MPDANRLDDQVGKRLASALIRAESVLSLLRHRADIDWGAVGLPTEIYVDEILGQAERAIKDAPEGWKS